MVIYRNVLGRIRVLTPVLNLVFSFDHPTSYSFCYLITLALHITRWVLIQLLVMSPLLFFKLNQSVVQEPYRLGGIWVRVLRRGAAGSVGSVTVMLFLRCRMLSRVCQLSVSQVPEAYVACRVSVFHFLLQLCCLVVLPMAYL